MTSSFHFLPKRLLLASVATVFLTAGIVFADDDKSDDKASDGLCVQTFNAYGPVYARKLKQRTRALTQNLGVLPDCEVYLFQEVWKSNHARSLVSGMRGQVQGFSAHVYDAHRRDSKKTGLLGLLLGRVSKTRSELFEFDRDGWMDNVRGWLDINKGFGASYVEFADFAGETFLVINLHLHHSTPHVRIAQILQLYEWLESQEFEGPMIVAGDFNVEPYTTEYLLIRNLFGMRDAFVDANRVYRKGDCTYCGSNALSWDSDDRVIDYVFYRSGKNLPLRATFAYFNLTKYAGRTMSDHHGVRTILSRDTRALGARPTAPTRSQKRIALISARAYLSTQKNRYKDVLADIENWLSKLKD